MPVVLPPVNITNGVTSLTANDLCLLYVEGFNIIIVNGGEASYLTVNSDGKNTFVWDSSYYNCSVNNSTQGTARFVIAFINFDYSFRNSPADLTLDSLSSSFSTEVGIVAFRVSRELMELVWTEKMLFFVVSEEFFSCGPKVQFPWRYEQSAG